jgi:hypothetical protein
VERYRLIDYAAAKEAWERNEGFRIPSNDGGAEVDPTYMGKGLQLLAIPSFFEIKESGGA